MTQKSEQWQQRVAPPHIAPAQTHTDCHTALPLRHCDRNHAVSCSNRVAIQTARLAAGWVFRALTAGRPTAPRETSHNTEGALAPPPPKCPVRVAAPRLPGRDPSAARAGSPRGGQRCRANTDGAGAGQVQGGRTADPGSTEHVRRDGLSGGGGTLAHPGSVLRPADGTGAAGQPADPPTHRGPSPGRTQSGVQRHTSLVHTRQPLSTRGARPALTGHVTAVHGVPGPAGGAASAATD